MHVKIWGCRGSIPSPGKHTLKYGGESTCVEVYSDDGEHIILDSGSGIRKLGQEILKNPEITHLKFILTHSHWDHLSGFPFFVPAYLSKYSITLCGGSETRISIMKYLAHQMEPPYFPVSFAALKANFELGCHCNQEYCDHTLGGNLHSISCHSIPLNHPNGGYGFKFVEKDRSFVFLTDNEIRFDHQVGKTRDDYVKFCNGASLLFHDAQWTESEYPKRQSWGHSTIMDAVDLAIDAGVESLGLFHHDPERSDKEIDQNLAYIRKYLKSKGSKLHCFACSDGLVLDV